MKAGRLRHRVRVDAPTRGMDSLGAPTSSWSTLVEVQADVSYVSGREYMAASRDLSEEVIRVYMREVPGVHLDAGFRLTDVDNNQQIDIVSILRDHTRSMLTIVGKAGSSHS